jgi:hypothetical protein
MSVKHCSSRNLCPIGQDHARAVERARLADNIDRGRTAGVGRAYDEAMAAWRRHSEACARASKAVRARRTEGFNRSGGCDACVAVSIQGIACHEHGCPNARRVSP